MQGVVNKLGKDFIIGIPASHKRKVEASKEAMDYYTTYIEPDQIIEVYFTPSNK